MQPYIKRVAATPRGKVTERKIKIAILNGERTYALYTPPGYNPAQENKEGDAPPLVLMFDGGAYYTDGFIPGPTIIDNLIAAKKIPPIVMAFVDHKVRSKDLNCSRDFAAYLATELVPFIRNEQHTSIEESRQPSAAYRSAE